MSKNNAVWLVTGCSSGLGLSLARALSMSGNKAVVTARRPADLEKIAAAAPERIVTMPLDICEPDQINMVVKATEARFGRIDVLVNNAGYGYQASVEEGVDERVRAMFEVNVFGVFAITRAVLPIMRRQRRGHILNVTSVGGLIGYPASGYYCGSKHTIEGWSDSLKLEVSPLGIEVTCVEPGPFRTEFAGRSMEQTSSQIDDYSQTVKARMDYSNSYTGTQPGDPDRAARIMIDIALRQGAPRHLVLGANGHDVATTKLRERLAEIESLRDLAVSADYTQ